MIYVESAVCVCVWNKTTVIELHSRNTIPLPPLPLPATAKLSKIIFISAKTNWSETANVEYIIMMKTLYLLV